MHAMGFLFTRREVNEVNVVQVIACAHGTICVCAMRMCVCLLEKNAHSTVDLWSFEFLPGTFSSDGSGQKIAIVLQKRCCDGVFRIFMQCACFVAYFDVFPENAF